MHKRLTGFTIAELLIVIAVIGILVAITVVAYKGSQERAYLAKIGTAAKTYSDRLKLYRFDNGTYPDTGGSNVCLTAAGTLPADSRFGLNACQSDGTATINTTINTALEQGGKLPDSTFPAVPYVESPNVFTRSLLYQTFQGKAYIRYYMKNKQQACPIGTSSPEDFEATCVLVFE